MIGKYVIASQKSITMPNGENIDVEIFFTLTGDSFYTTDINKALEFSANRREEAENMIKLLVDKDFAVAEIPEVTRGAK